MKLSRFDPVWYRLLKTLPWEVVAGRTVYRFDVTCRMPSGDGHWELVASFKGGDCIVSEFFHRRERLESALYETGFCTRHLTPAEALMERVVRLGWAERRPQPEFLPPIGEGQPWAC